MRPFTKLAAVFTITALLFTLSTPAFTQENEPVWEQGTDAWVFGLSWEKSGGETTVRTSGQWLHYISERQAWGVALALLKMEDTESATVGPSWEWNFPKLRFGRFFILSNAQVAAGDASNLATGIGLLGVGYKVFVGDTTAVRFVVDYSDTINEAAEPPPELEQMAGAYNFGIQIEFGVNPGTTVQ